jgi:hypothetical protein
MSVVNVGMGPDEFRQRRFMADRFAVQSNFANQQQWQPPQRPELIRPTPISAADKALFDNWTIHEIDDVPMDRIYRAPPPTAPTGLAPAASLRHVFGE